ncbi:alpha/beta hydrolase [Streptomyces winkii]|uniref:alpha/beta hydrolase n=1 Tax=Streptomyces winkii TaxID=3051178 RepID=UPI0028D8689B|nr:alpha/beta hydrolase [Streptomyces sp. DSM 40971]
MAVAAGTVVVSTAHGQDAGGTAVVKELKEQKPDWEPCYKPGPDEQGAFEKGTPDLDLKGHGDDYERAECATVDVPLDWADPAGEKASIAVSRLKASDQRKAGKKAVFQNPGGPGGAGRVSAIRTWVENGPTEVPRNMDIVGFDPRGTGASMPAVGYCGNQFAYMPILKETNLDLRDLASPDEKKKAATQDAYKESYKQFAEKCKETVKGLRYITTQQTIRDVDLIRAVLGYEEISWVGYSAGTAMGAYYAAAFPNRVGRFVLDSVVDPKGSWERPVDRETGKAAQASLGNLAAGLAELDVVRDVDGDGQADSLGTSKAEVLESYEAIRETLPRKVGGKDMSKYMFDQVTRQAMYSDTEQENLARLWLGLRKAAVGGAAEVDAATVEAYDALKPYFTLTGAESAIRCQDAQWARTVEDERTGKDVPTVDHALGIAEQTAKQYPFAGWATLSPCMFWDAPRGEALPDVGKAELPGMLLVNSKEDHATPLSSAKGALAKLPGSRLLTVDGGNHALYRSGNTCVDEKVEVFLLDGTLPQEGANCPEA